MLTTQKQNELVRLSYECALDAHNWPHFLKEFAKVVKAESASVVIQDLKNLRGGVAETWGVDPFWQRRYAEYYAATNVWTQRAEQIFLPGTVLLSQHILSDSDLLATEFYNDFLRPQASFHAFGTALTREDGVASFVTALRSRRAGYFGPAEVELLRYLAPHLQTAVQLRHRIAGLEDQVKHLGAALDELPQGLMIVDRLGRVLFMNRRAETAVREKDGLWIASGGLCATLAEETKRLRTWIARVASWEPQPGGVLSLHRPGKGPLKLLIAPLKPSPHRPVRGPAALIWIAFPEPLAPTSPALLQELFLLTRMEARLTAALLEGKTVQEFAESAGISVQTVKTHLKNVFSKTGVSRQSALIRCVLDVVDQLGRPH